MHMHQSTSLRVSPYCQLGYPPITELADAREVSRAYVHLKHLA